MDSVAGLVPIPTAKAAGTEQPSVYGHQANTEAHDDEVYVQKTSNPTVAAQVDIKEQAVDLSELPVDDTLGLYLKEAASAPLLSFEEEIGLAKAVHKGREARHKLSKPGVDPDECKCLEQDVQNARLARDRLILANTRLVIGIAKKHRGRGVSFLDLIQEGNVGLMKAVERYDYTRGYRFSTYAHWWIRQCVTRSIADQGRTIRIPVHMSAQIGRLYKTAYRLEQAYDRRPTPEEIAQEMGLKPRKVRWMLKVSRHPFSLECPVGEERDGELGALIEDDGTPAPPENAYQHLLRDDLEKALNTLTPRQARVLRLRFGLQDGHSYTLREIGRKYGLTRERIRQIQIEALRRLRHPRRSRQLRDYLG